MLAYGLQYFFLCSIVGSKISPTADPATWQIAKPYLYTGYFENATNPYIEDLTTRLSSSEGPGTSMSKSEFVALIDRPESREVYSEKLIKIATQSFLFAIESEEF